MALGSRLGTVSCVIALSGLAMAASVSAQPMPYGPSIMIPGPDGVLRLDQQPPPRRGYVIPRDYAFDDEVISQRYLDSLPRRKIKRPIVHARRVRTADAASQAQPAAPAPAVQPAKPEPEPKTESAKPDDDTDALREQVARLNSQTQTLRGDIAALKAELLKRIAATEQRPEPPKTAAVASNDELVKIKDEAARLKDETSRLRSEGDGLRDQLAKLVTETGSLRTGIAALKDELAKRPTAAPKIEEPRNDELPKVKEEAARLREETTRLRGDSDQLRELVVKLTADTGGLRSEIASLKEELAKRPVSLAPASPTVTGKVDQQVKPEEPLRRADSLKKSGKSESNADNKSDNKVIERVPGGEEREVERMASTMERVWRRLLEMVGKPKDAP